jgi:ADP-glucose pyrophosphorylase
MAFVLAGGRGSRLKELTDKRAKPAVYFGGKTRIIDFALSNALNSGIRKMAIATQYKAHSLIRHCQRGWNFFRPERNEYLDILPASQRVEENKWYLGTADAVTQNIDIVDSYHVDYVLILAGDHVYKMDYEIMLRQHVESGADVTVGCLTVPREEATAFGVMAVDKDDRITDFLEKPADPPGHARGSGGRAGLDGHLRLPGRSCASFCWPMPTIRTPGMISAAISFPTSSRTARRWRTASRTAACGPPLKRRPTGATSAPSMLSGRPIST